MGFGLSGDEEFNGLMLILLYVLIISVILSLIFYVISSLAYQKVLQFYHYRHIWAAWIPFYCLYALADVAGGGSDTINVFGADISNSYFRFWWVLLFPLGMLQFGSLLSSILKIICLSTCFTEIFSRMENKPKDQCLLIGVLSGIFGIVAVVKIFTIEV